MRIIIPHTPLIVILSNNPDNHRYSLFGRTRKKGFVECWTVVNVDKIDIKLAERESPSTNRFYRISQLINDKSGEYVDFRNRILSLTGVPGCMN
jgi:hypothetical protein